LTELTARYRHTAESTLNAIALVAFANILDAFDENGKLIAPENMRREIGAAIRKLERVEIKGRDADGNPIVIGHTINVELWDKLAALRMLGQHYGLFVERMEVAPGRDFATVLREARGALSPLAVRIEGLGAAGRAGSALTCRVNSSARA
jgi:hypothetical protein